MQSNFCKLLGVPYHGLPQDLLEAFSHDPSAVTGRTRRFNGYQAVDDIHHRVVRQRAIIQGFINSHPETSSSIPTEGHVKKPIDNLLLSLNKIHDIRQELAVKATEVSDVLAKVQKTQAAVKSEYNDALSHVSVVYPEVCDLDSALEVLQFMFCSWPRLLAWTRAIKINTSTSGSLVWML